MELFLKMCEWAIFDSPHRSGALKPEDLEKDYEDDLDFLFAKLKLAQENKEVSIMVNDLGLLRCLLSFLSCLPFSSPLSLYFYCHIAV